MRGRSLRVMNDAEVHDRRALGMSLGVIEVRWLDVAMGNAPLMHLVKPAGEPFKCSQDLDHRQAPAIMLHPADCVVQGTPRHAVQEFHDEKHVLIADFSTLEEINEPDKVGIIQFLHRPSFFEKLLLVLGLEQPLDCHILPV